MECQLPESLLPILAAVFAGGLIGLEREWRGRAAGFRTHILVCLASALLMQAAVTQGDWGVRLLPDERLVTDPTRMAHGILTGIGFLCAGVIFRTGFSIHGLTSAASLWITSALGILFGAGLYDLGVLGTGVTVVILVLLRLVSLRLPARAVIDVEVAWVRDGASPLAEIERVLRDLDREARHMRFELTEGGRCVRQHWKLKVRGERDLQTLADRIGGLPPVTAFVLSPRED